MRFRCATFALMFMVLAIAALAHGDKKHVTGTIDKISADSVVVKTSEGALVEVKLVASTVYTLHAGQNDQPAKFADLAVGARAVIHATPKGDRLEAAEIKFSMSGAAASAPPAGKPKP